MKAQIMRIANQLCGMLECCGDVDFVDAVIFAVSCNEPFEEEQIAEQEVEE